LALDYDRKVWETIAMPHKKVGNEFYYRQYGKYYFSVRAITHENGGIEVISWGWAGGPQRFKESEYYAMNI
jgi:hypothetical protein